MLPDKRGVARLRRMPALVLNEARVAAQVHGHGCAANGAAGNQLRRNPHVPLLPHHPSYGGFVVIGARVAGLRALPEAVVPLGVEQARPVEARDLKLMVHVRGQHEAFPLPNQVEKVEIRLPGGHIVAVDVDVTAPPRPVFLQRFKGIEAAGIDVPDAVFLREIRKVLFKARAGVGHPRCGGQPRARADQHRVRPLQRLAEPVNLRRGVCGREARPVR